MIEVPVRSSHRRDRSCAVFDIHRRRPSPRNRARARIAPSLSLAAALLPLLSLLSPAGSAAHAEPSRVGIMADVGLPDGLVGAVTVRAHRHVHMHAGAGHNSVSPGARLGVQFVVGDRVAPYLAAEGGHYLAGDANPFARGLAARAGAGDAELERLGYSFASAHLGLRLGGRGAAFYMQGGVSFVRPVMSFRETSTAQMSDDITVDVISESVFHVWTPSARVGLIAYF